MPDVFKSALQFSRSVQARLKMQDIILHSMCIDYVSVRVKGKNAKYNNTTFLLHFFKMLIFERK